MKILVPIKRVLDYNIKVRINSDGSDVDLANVKMAMNPFDEIAVEEAVKLKEAGVAAEVVVVSCGSNVCQETLRSALALGADRAILVEGTDNFQPLSIAKLLSAIVDREQPALVICGKQAIDDDSNQTGQMLAALRGWSQACFASRIVASDDRKSLTVTREIDGGLENLIIQLPAVVTADLRLNVPRYASLPNIMKAKKKPLEVIAAQSLGVDIRPHIDLLGVTTPPVRQAGIRVPDVTMLVHHLRKYLKANAS
jgi:electron transfer flavoprotein beta subunit